MVKPPFLLVLYFDFRKQKVKKKKMWKFISCSLLVCIHPKGSYMVDSSLSPGIFPSFGNNSVTRSHADSHEKNLAECLKDRKE